MYLHVPLILHIEEQVFDCHLVSYHVDTPVEIREK